MGLASLQVARLLGSRVTFAAPPYQLAGLHRPPSNDVPLGTVVIGKGDVTIAVLAELTAMVHQWPWVVPCLVVPANHEPITPLLMLVTELRDRLVLVGHGSSAASDELQRVLTSVKQRSLPTPGGMAAWIAARVGRSDLEAHLGLQFREALHGVRASTATSVSTFSRVFARHGPYTAHDWRALARLCGHASAHFQCSTRFLSLRTASHYAKRYLAVPYRVMAERLGWEWILEAALRAGSYI